MQPCGGPLETLQPWHASSIAILDPMCPSLTVLAPIVMPAWRHTGQQRALFPTGSGGQRRCGDGRFPPGIGGRLPALHCLSSRHLTAREPNLPGGPSTSREEGRLLLRLCLAAPVLC